MISAPRPTKQDTWLTIDRGNSTLDCALHRASSTRRVCLDPSSPEAFCAWIGNERPVAIAGASAVQGGLSAVEEKLRDLGLSLKIAGQELPCPLQLAYPDPSQLGVDRWLAAFAAHMLYGAALVVDCGTATTVNAVSASGVFLGGAIGPGLQALQDALIRSAPRLKTVQLDPKLLHLPAVTTEDAIRAGVLLTAAGGIERLTAGTAAATGLEAAMHLLTGGNAHVLAPMLDGFTLVDDLVHQGLRWLLHRSISNC